MNPTTGTALRRAVAATGAAVLVLALAACGSSSSSEPTTPSPTGESQTSAAGADPAVVGLLPAGVKDSGTLSVGTEAQYPPFEFYDTDNKTIIGFDADIAAGLAKLMGLQLEMNDAAFDSIIPSIAGARYDLGISAFTVTAERIEQVDFVTYYYEGDGLMVKAGNPNNLSIGNALCGAKIAVLKGSTQALRSTPTLDKDCKDAGSPAIDVTVVPGSNDLGLSLTSGRVDAVLTDGSNAAYTAKLSDGKFEVAPGDPFNPAPFGIASKKDSGMAQAVQKALEAMIADGSYQQALEKWGMQAGAVKTPQINEVSR